MKSQQTPPGRKMRELSGSTVRQRDPPPHSSDVVLQVHPHSTLSLVLPLWPSALLATGDTWEADVEGKGPHKPLKSYLP